MSIPTMFFHDQKLHRRIKIVRSDNSLVAWCYADEERVWLPLPYIRDYYKNAYTISRAAALINCTPGRIKEIIDKGLFPEPERAYNFTDGSYNPLQKYVNEEDMLVLRQTVWDTLPKNRFGEPYNDSITSEIELEHKLRLQDSREYFVRDDGSVIKIYKA